MLNELFEILRVIDDLLARLTERMAHLEAEMLALGILPDVRGAQFLDAASDDGDVPEAQSADL